MSALRRVFCGMAALSIHSHVRLALLVCLLLVGGLSGSGASTAHAYCRLTTKMPMPGDNCAEDGAPLVWKRRCISFSMTDRMRSDPPLSDMRDVADLSFKAWSDVTCDGKPVGLQIRETEPLGECIEPEYNRSAANANTVIFVSDWAARGLPRDAFGLTLVWHNPDSGDIYDADMQINETLGSLSICNGVCASGSVDLRNVITHEAGHFLGLGHSTVSRATMAARATVGEIKKRDLDTDDIEGLCSIYEGAGDAKCETGDFDPDCGFSPICEPPDQGRSCQPVKSSKTSSGGCSVAAVGDSSSLNLSWLAGCALVLFAVGGQRRARQRALRRECARVR